MSKQRLVGGQSQRDLSAWQSGSRRVRSRRYRGSVHTVGFTDRRCIGLGKAYARLVAVGELEAGRLGFGAAGPDRRRRSSMNWTAGRGQMSIWLRSAKCRPLRIIGLKRERSSARNDLTNGTLGQLLCSAATFDCPSPAFIKNVLVSGLRRLTPKQNLSTVSQDGQTGAAKPRWRGPLVALRGSKNANVFCRSRRSSHRVCYCR